MNDKFLVQLVGYFIEVERKFKPTYFARLRSRLGVTKKRLPEGLSTITRRLGIRAIDQLISSLNSKHDFSYLDFTYTKTLGNHSQTFVCVILNKAKIIRPVAYESLN